MIEHGDCGHLHNGAIVRRPGINLRLAAPRYSTGTLIVLLALFSPIQFASAANMKFLENTIVSRFDRTDWEMLRKATNEALENHEDGSSVRWQNAESGHSGTITPTNTTDQDELRCRSVKLTVRAGQETRSSVRKFCKAGGEWKIAQ